MGDFPILKTKHPMLREFWPSDASAVFDIFSRDEVTRYHNIETMLEPAQAEKLVTARARFSRKGWVSVRRSRCKSARIMSSVPVTSST